MKKLAERLWNEPAFALAALAAAADGILVIGAGLPPWVLVIVHLVQGLGTRALVTPTRASDG